MKTKESDRWGHVYVCSKLKGGKLQLREAKKVTTNQTRLSGSYNQDRNMTQGSFTLN